MNKKNTKRALLLSVLSLLMCCTMLVGSTFAWFTDSATVRNNVITSGNLDVELEYLNADGEWKPVDENTVLFDENALWEPGYTQAVALKVKNVGSLALKYELKTNVYLETEGTNVYGKQFLLSDYLEVYTQTQEDNVVGEIFASNFVSKRNWAQGTGTDLESVKFNELLSKGTLNAGQGHVQVLSVVMPTTVGNEANHQTGTDAPVINFGIELVATQAPVESDSFDNQYDANAEFEVIPAAEVTTLDVEEVTATLGMGGSDAVYSVDKAFRFKATDDKAAAQASEYRYWHADFVVSADKDIATDSMALLGYYEAFCKDYNDDKWVALVNEGEAITAGTQIRLLELLLNGGSMNYEELCEYVPTFDCGVSDLGDNTGTTITVELRLYEVTHNAASTSVETGNYIVAGRYTHKF